jgi:hypothetical protein
MNQPTEVAARSAVLPPAEDGGGTTRSGRRRFPLNVRHTVLTAHIVFSVALLGDSAGFLAVAIRTSTLDDPALVRDSLMTLNMFSLVFGIPLSFAALLTGIALGLGTRWGVFRYPWVVIKLALIVGVLLVGSFIISPASSQMLDGDGDTTGRLITGAAIDVIALTAAATLAVFKPGRAFRNPRRGRHATPS